MPPRLSLYGFLSTAIFAITILNAFRQRSNFYAAAVYLSKSNACMMILWNESIFLITLFGKLLQSIFFGELRMLEIERLQERGWFAITETLLALTIFREEFDSSFILLFISLLFLKVFHWLIADRIEWMEQSAVISPLFHLRMSSLLFLLWGADLLFLYSAIDSILIDGPTVMIMFASEYMILVATIWSSTLKYAINTVDLRREDVWEEKSMLVFYVDLATDFFKLVTYLTFFGLILTFYGLPLNILRDVYITFRSFILKCRDLRRYRRATHDMDNRYPNATREEMTVMVDKTCIICREDMEFLGPPEPIIGADGVEVVGDVPILAELRTGPNETPKKLPCGHVFHFHCLRSWLERQQSCPTCRRPVLDQTRQTTPPVVEAPPVVAPGAVDPVWQARVNLARNLGREAFAVVFPGVEFPAEAAVAAPPPTPTVLVAGGAAPVVGDANAAIAPTPTIPPNRFNLPVPFPEYPAPVVAASDNPLTRFSLSLPLPPTSEAGLYTQPGPGLPSGYAGIAYGTYKCRGSLAASFSSPNAGTSTPRSSRAAMLQERMAAANQNSFGSRFASTSSAFGISSVLKPTTPSSANSSHDTLILTIGRLSKLQDILEANVAAFDAQMANGVSEDVKGRLEIAKEATELKLRESRRELKKVLEEAAATVQSDSTTASIKEPGTTNQEETPKVELPSVTRRLYPALNPSVTSNPPTMNYPRLIPLFDPVAPQQTTAFPHLLSRLPKSSLQGPASAHPRSIPSTPLFPTTATDTLVKDNIDSTQAEGELEEVGRLTKGMLEGKLKLVLKYQRELERLAGDIKEDVDSINSSTTSTPVRSLIKEGIKELIVLGEGENDDNEAVSVIDKGKKTTEGVNAC